MNEAQNRILEVKNLHAVFHTKKGVIQNGEYFFGRPSIES